MRKHIVKWAAMLYLVAMFFGSWGYSVGKFGIFPSAIVDPVVEDTRAFIRGGEIDKDKSIFAKFTMHRQEIKDQDHKSVMGDLEVPETHEIVGSPDGGKFFIYDNNFYDPGYLLISRFSWAHQQVIVELVRICDRTLLHRWVPPIKEILEKDEYPEDEECNSFEGYRVQHPFLFKDGSIVFTSGEGPLVRINKYSEIQWIISGIHFHHSIERDAEGNLYVPVVITPQDKVVHSQSNLREDGFAIVSPEGDILQKFSMARILIDNGYRGLVFGVGEIEKDRFHLNDAQPINTNAGILKRGDVALSMRHLSTVLVYRPKEAQVIALSVGPWLMQHDVNPLLDGKISIFNNENVRPSKEEFDGLSKISSVMIWDPANDRVVDPYKPILKKLNVYTPTNGRSRILPNGDAFIDSVSRLLRVSKYKPRWIYGNIKKDSNVHGALHWCRYLLETEITPFWEEEK